MTPNVEVRRYIEPTSTNTGLPIGQAALENVPRLGFYASQKDRPAYQALLTQGSHDGEITMTAIDADGIKVGDVLGITKQAGPTGRLESTSPGVITRLDVVAIARANARGSQVVIKTRVSR